MSSLEGANLFVLHGICILGFVTLYNIIFKYRYICVSYFVFLNLYMVLSTNIKYIIFIGEIIFELNKYDNNKLNLYSLLSYSAYILLPITRIS